jgi:hypothetical protein
MAGARCSVPKKMVANDDAVTRCEVVHTLACVVGGVSGERESWRSARSMGPEGARRLRVNVIQTSSRLISGGVMARALSWGSCSCRLGAGTVRVSERSGIAALFPRLEATMRASTKVVSLGPSQSSPPLWQRRQVGRVSSDGRSDVNT